MELNYQMFADANTQTTGGLSAEMKTYYGMELLENAKPALVHNQFAATKPLPVGGGKTVEWRKWNTLPDAEELTEGVIPTGQKMGQPSMTGALKQIGLYVTVSDQLELHALDDVILGATEVPLRHSPVLPWLRGSGCRPASCACTSSGLAFSSSCVS